MIRSIAIIASALLLGGCPGPQVIDTSCTVFTPGTYSASQDSEATKAWIRGHNAAWMRICGK